MPRTPVGSDLGETTPRAKAIILSLAARLVMSGRDGVTARDVADAMRELTCARSRATLSGDGSNGTNGTRAAEKTLEEATRGEGWVTRGREDVQGGETIYDFPGREYRPPRSWLGGGGGERKGGTRKRAPHASVRDVLRLCHEKAETRAVEDVVRERGFGENATSPEKRKAPRTVNPLTVIAEREKSRQEAKEKAKQNKSSGKSASGGGNTTATQDGGAKKKRKVDLANEKAGNHLALVSWIGKGKKDGVRCDRTFYDGFTRDGVEFKNGDSVYCLPERATEDMYLAQIQRCFEDEDKSMMIECCWYMTQDEVLAWGGEISPKTSPDEIFLGTSVDVNPISALEGLAPVRTRERYEKTASVRKKVTDPAERELFAARCYVPVHGYNPKSKNAAQRKAGTFYPLDHVPGRGFVVRWPASKKSKSKKH